MSDSPRPPGVPSAPQEPPVHVTGLKDVKIALALAREAVERAFDALPDEDGISFHDDYVGKDIHNATKDIMDAACIYFAFRRQQHLTNIGVIADSENLDVVPWLSRAPHPCAERGA